MLSTRHSDAMLSCMLIGTQPWRPDGQRGKTSATVTKLTNVHSQTCSYAGVDFQVFHTSGFGLSGARRFAASIASSGCCVAFVCLMGPDWTAKT
jgi:hypothetical protein